MADEEVATKAPESDGNDKSIVPGDTPAQEGASMGVSYAKFCLKHSIVGLMSCIRSTA